MQAEFARFHLQGLRHPALQAHGDDRRLQLQLLEAYLQQLEPVPGRTLRPRTAEAQFRRPALEMEKTEAYALGTDLPRQQKLFMRQQQFPADVEQQFTIRLLLGHLVVGTETLGRSPGIAGVRQVTQRTVEFEQVCGAEAARESLARQTQAIADRHHAHAAQCLAQAGRPVQAGQRQPAQDRRNILRVTNARPPTRPRQPGRGERGRCNGQRGVETELPQAARNLLSQFRETAEQPQAARDLEQQHIAISDRDERGKVLQPGSQSLERLLLLQQAAFLELQRRQ